MIQALDNNPIKFSPTTDDALRIMLGPRTKGYLDTQADPEAELRRPEDAPARDLCRHAEGGGDADGAVRPEGDRAGDGEARIGVIGSRKSALWDAYVARWEAVLAEHDNGFIDAFVGYFSRCYQRGEKDSSETASPTEGMRGRNWDCRQCGSIPHPLRCMSGVRGPPLDAGNALRSEERADVLVQQGRLVGRGCSCGRITCSRTTAISSTWSRAGSGDLTPYPWGFSALEIDRDLAQQSKFALRRAAGVMPDGTPFDMPGDSPLPDADRGAGQRRAGRSLWLSLPVAAPNTREVDDAATPRAPAATPSRSETLIDSTSPLRVEEEIEVAYPRLALRAAQDRRSPAIVGLADRARAARCATRSIIFDEQFVPPLLDLLGASGRRGLDSTG